MSGESDVAKLAGLAGRDQRGIGPFLIKNTMRIFEAKNFMMLDKIDAVELQTFERFVELFSSLFLRTSINLGHDKRFFAIAIAHGLAHASFLGAVVVLPT